MKNEKVDVLATPKPDPMTIFKTPKITLLIVIKAGMAKSVMLWWQTLALAWSAGIAIAIGGALVYAVVGAMGSFAVSGSIPVYDGTDTTSGSVHLTVAVPAGVKKLMAGVLFPVVLMLIVLSGADLFTGDVMYMLAAKMANKCTWLQLVRNWILAYFGNLCGCLATAYFLLHLTEMFADDPWRTYIETFVHAKTSHGNFGTFFLKGIGANYLVCHAVWNQLTAEDAISKIIGIWWPLMAFVAIGFEHSIANMFYIPMAMMNHYDLSANEFIRINLVPVTIGNIVGGGLFVLVQYLVYHPYMAVDLAAMKLKQGNKKAGIHLGWLDGHHIPGHEHSIFSDLHAMLNSFLETLIGKDQDAPTSPISPPTSPKAVPPDSDPNERTFANSPANSSPPAQNTYKRFDLVVQDKV